MITLTAAPRSATTHGISATAGMAHTTICGRAITETWAGEMDGGIPAGIPTCKRCAANVDAGYPVTAAARDGARMITVQDGTGDTLAEWDRCIVGARFTRQGDAADFLAGARTMADRPARCVLPSGGYGACIRQDGHPGQCRDANGHRFTIPTEADAIVSECEAAGIPVAADGLPVVGHPVWKVAADNGAGIRAGIRVWVRRERARSMAAHPAGKGRAPSAAREALAARGTFLPRRTAEARVIAGESMADRLTGDPVRVLSRSYGNAYARPVRTRY